MITISKSYSFDAAHQLYRNDWTEEQNDRVFGKCARLHGHTYTMEVELTGDVDPVSGMILNYFLLDQIVKPLVEHSLDHQFLNELFDKADVDLTTAENMVGQIAKWIKRDLAVRYDNIFVRKVTLQETPKTKAVWHNI